MLERFRKQAKLYLRWHRAGYHPVAARIRAGLPRFASHSDREILAARFRLADAQELVARLRGFDGWPALRQGLNDMPEQNRPLIDKATLLAAEPQLFVSDIAASCAWFAEKLGFETAFVYGEPAFYAQVVRDGARLNLRHVDGPVFADDLKRREGDLLAASIAVDDIRPLFAELEARGAAIHQRPRAEPWGGRTFIVADPDGNLILFASALAKDERPA
jgi:catechol 2,3-dioxygenase-like lactoylglutathione lyase family enzyme